MSKRIVHGLLVVVAASLFATEGALAQCNTNDPTAPCFANTSDILSGRNSLLRDDDLVISGTLADANVYTATALTQAGQITSSYRTNLNPQTSSNTSVISAQLFDESPREVLIANTAQSGTVSINPAKLSVNVPGLSNAFFVYGVAADFLGSGFDQVVFMSSQFNPPLLQIGFQGLAAVDPYHPSAGLKVGPASQLIDNSSNVFAIAVGIFTDPVPGQPLPRPEIAVYSGNSNPEIAIGGPIPPAIITFYAVDENLNVTPTGQSIQVGVSSQGTARLLSLDLAAGRFTGGTHDQLVAAYGFNGSQIGFATIDFDAQGNPVLKSNSPLSATSAVLSYANPYGGALNLSTGHFDWYGNADQVAFSYFPGNDTGNISSLQVVSFDPNMQPIFNPAYTLLSCPMGLAVGRFDQMTATNPPAPNPNLQIARFLNTCQPNQSGSNFIDIYNVDPTKNFAITLNQSYPVPTSLFPQAPLYYNQSYALGQAPTPIQMVASDIQGRSLALGTPTKTTITGHVQPDTVLGVPPMHVDWITPAGGNVPEVFNVSVYPGTFNASYSFQSGTTGTVSRSAQTSYTAATKLSVNAKISYGIPLVASASLSSTIAAGNVQKNTVNQKYNTYSGNKLGFSTNTVFDDVVAATTSQMNVYSYRVIGQCVAAPNAPALEGCAAGTQPLYIQFSGPDNIEYISAAEGRNLEWYQPVWEPGNLFSYPANQQQLAAELAGGTSFQALSPANSVWDVQTASQVTESWTDGGGSNVSSGSQSTQSFDASVSASAMVSFEGIGASAGVTFDYNDSTSTSTLNESGSTFSDSQGIVLNRGISTSSDLYDYQGQSLIYGQLPPNNVVDTGTAPNTQVKANGFIGVAHLADMVSQGGVTSGNFWPQAYAVAPDIALNHPQRWLQKAPSGVNPQQVQFNCPVGYSSSLSSPFCSSSPEAPTPANVADAVFYQMKGLFVTPGGSTNGPQMENTVKGNTVTLRARIYNYSLVNFPAGSYAHVQFYAQPWNPELGEFASVPGNPNQFAPAVFIGEDDIVPPPAFCGGVTGSGDPCLGSQVLNWEFAQATWDTSQANVTPDSTWKFWVLVWVENGGKLVSELPGHGLISIPAAPYNSIGDAPIEPYSNNVGYYNQVFTVFGAPGLGKSTGSPKLSVEPVNLLGGALMRDRPITLRAKHQATGGNINSLLTLYYDGDPEHGGVLFDTQSISRVSIGHSYVDTANYRPLTCGNHQIFVQSIPLDGSASPATGTGSLDVTIDPVESVNEMIQYVQDLPHDRSSHGIIGLLEKARHEFEEGNTKAGRESIQRLLDYLAHDHDCNRLPEKAKKAISAQSEDLLQCVP